eukprot:2599786-Amphidinium_carterae.1
MIRAECTTYEIYETHTASATKVELLNNFNNDETLYTENDNLTTYEVIYQKKKKHNWQLKKTTSTATTVL